MARTSARARPDRERVLVPSRRLCPACGGVMRIRYENRRTLALLSGPVRLRLKVRRCERDGCSRHHHPYRPEVEGAMALPQHEFGLDVVVLVGTLRHREHRSVPEIHAALRGRGVEIAERSVTNLLDRYDELLATSLCDSLRLRRVLAGQDRVILALDGLQPDVGHEVLWVVRDCLSGEVLLARSLLSGTAADLAPLLREVADAVVERAYAWVHAAARVLNNVAGEDAARVRRRFEGLVSAMRRHRGRAGTLEPAIGHFLKVARSYRAGLFHCYAVTGLPRTNNDLEQLFGSQRYHERRATGRKAASPAAVLRGEVRLIAATATRLHPPTARDLAAVKREAWAKLRKRLDQRRHARTLRTRFRRDPAAYLANLKQQARQPTLPA